MSRNQNCSRCGSELGSGTDVEDNATYVEASDETTEHQTTKIVARVLSDRAKDVRDRLVKEEGLSVEQANNAVSRNDDAFDENITDEELDTVEVESPNEAVGHPDAVRVDEVPTVKESPAKLLVCDDCVKDDDEVIW